MNPLRHTHCEALLAPTAAVVESVSTAEEQLVHESSDLVVLKVPVEQGVHALLSASKPRPAGHTQAPA